LFLKDLLSHHSAKVELGHFILGSNYHVFIYLILIMVIFLGSHAHFIQLNLVNFKKVLVYSYLLTRLVR
jgi:hypothetical protein